MSHCVGSKVLEIANGNDQVIGGQCSICLKVLFGVGTCHGCGKGGAKLRLVVGESKRYCGPECRNEELKREKEKKPVAAGARR